MNESDAKCYSKTHNLLNTFYFGLISLAEFHTDSTAHNLEMPIRNMLLKFLDFQRAAVDVE